MASEKEVTAHRRDRRVFTGRLICRALKQQLCQLKPGHAIMILSHQLAMFAAAMVCVATQME